MLEYILQNIKKFPSKEQLASSLADDVCAVLKGGGSLILSGGSTPKPFLQELNNRNLDWRNITIGLTDERLVDVNSSDSNENLIRSHLTSADLNFVALNDDAAICEANIAKIAKPFDVVILGMGEDGHFASIFPDSPDLEDLLDVQNPSLCANVNPKTAPYSRITLTLCALLKSKKIILYITGDAKLETLKKALESEDYTKYPIYAMLNQEISPLEIYWTQ